jgi:hypothetical protein
MNSLLQAANTTVRGAKTQPLPLLNIQLQIQTGMVTHQWMQWFEQFWMATTCVFLCPTKERRACLVSRTCVHPQMSTNLNYMFTATPAPHILNTMSLLLLSTIYNHSP